MTPDINILTLTSHSIKMYIPSIAKLRAQVLSECPYLSHGQIDTDLNYLKHLSQYKDTVVVVVFDGPTIVGVSTGMPLSGERHQIQEPFITQGFPIEKYYYFDLSALLKPYRNRGIAHHFFELREKHVSHLRRFSKICFTSTHPVKESCQVIEPVHLESFWKKRGYVEFSEMTTTYLALNQPCKVALKFWIKSIPLISTSYQQTLSH